MQPLRSIPITETSSLLQAAPSLCLASVLSLSWGLHLSFSLDIEATGSHVPHRGLSQSHATFMPDAAQTVSRFPLDLSWRTESHQFWRRQNYFRHLIGWFACARLSDSQLIPSCRTFSSTLTTTAL